MESNEIIKQLEVLIEAEKSRLIEKEANKSAEKEKNDAEIKNSTKDKSSEVKEEVPSFWHYLLDILKAPFVYFAEYLKSEITEAIKNDIKKVYKILILSMLLFSLIVTLWITIQFCIYWYLILAGFTVIKAVLISVIIQFSSLTILMITIRKTSHNMDTLKLIRRIKEKH